MESVVRELGGRAHECCFLGENKGRKSDQLC